MGQAQLRVIGTASEIDLASEVRAALARLANDTDPNACFVVARSGVSWARADARDPATLQLCGGNSVLPAHEITPRWDRDNRVLSFGGRIIRRYGRSSPNQEAVLHAFEEQGWPPRIDDPLPFSVEVAPKPRLHDTIRWLNLKHECRLVRFLGDGTGEGLRWKLIEAAGPTLHANLVDPLRRAA